MLPLRLEEVVDVPLVVEEDCLKEKEELYLPDTLEDSLSIRSLVEPRASSVASTRCGPDPVPPLVLDRGAPQPFMSHPLSSKSETALRSRLYLLDLGATARVGGAHGVAPSMVKVVETERDGLPSKMLLSSSSVRQSSAGWLGRMGDMVLVA